MSFFDDASLAFLPSGGAGKDGKAYSIKPTDGTGDFTFSRGSNLTATRVGPTGLIEKGRENLLTYSNDFSQWTQVYVNTPTTGHAGYDGTNDAWLIERDGTAGGARIEKIISLSGVNTWSFYAKANSLEWVNLISTSSPFPLAYFNLTGVGSVSNEQGLIDANIERVGTTDWYRCSITFNFSGSTGFRIRPADGSGVVSGTSGSIYVQDAQAEIGLAATDYIESGASTGKAGLLENEPRFDYSGGATCPSLLLEPQRVQLIPYSEYFEGTGWSLVGSAIIAKSSSTNPMGQSFCYELQTSYTGYLRALISGKTGSSTHSIYVKRGGSNPATHIRLTNNNTAAWNTGTSVKHLLTNDWVRIDTQDGITTSNAYFNIGNVDESNVVDSDCAGTCLIWGGQVEDGSYPTSYIPNHSGGSATRTADASSVTGVSSLIGQTEGTILCEFTLDELGYDVDFLAINNSTNSEYIAIFKYTNNVMRSRIRANSISNTIDYSVTATGTYKVALKYNASTFALFVNGVKINEISATISFTSSIERVFVGPALYVGLGKAKYGQLLTLPEALSDADCITLTT